MLILAPAAPSPWPPRVSMSEFKLHLGAARADPIWLDASAAQRSSWHHAPMAYWLLKTEPSTYGWDDLEREKRAVWDGVTNPVALKNLRAARKGDEVAIYHTGDEKSAVGIAEVIREAYPDPKSDDEKLVVVELVPKRRLAKPVPLQALKADPAFSDSPLLRIGRLSVVPLDGPQWRALLALAR